MIKRVPLASHHTSELWAVLSIVPLHNVHDYLQASEGWFEKPTHNKTSGIPQDHAAFSLTEVENESQFPDFTAPKSILKIFILRIETCLTFIRLINVSLRHTLPSFRGLGRTKERSKQSYCR